MPVDDADPSNVDPQTWRWSARARHLSNVRQTLSSGGVELMQPENQPKKSRPKKSEQNSHELPQSPRRKPAPGAPDTKDPFPERQPRQIPVRDPPGDVVGDPQGDVIGDPAETDHPQGQT
jgi:hypothetical protein